MKSFLCVLVAACGLGAASETVVEVKVGESVNEAVVLRFAAGIRP